MKRLALFLLFILTCGSFSSAQGKEWIKEHYTKKEYRIPMRDGIKLFTAVYTPRDTTKEYPILMVRTPYRAAPYGEENYPNALGPNKAFAEEGYIFVFQDVRGKFMSEGEFVNMRPYIPDKKSKNDVDETTDTYDTIDWLVKNLKHNNGRVGIWGISYPGFYAAMSLIDSHPALKAVSPQAPIADWFIGDDMHHNGAFSLSMSFNFFKTFDQPRDSLTTTWKTIEPYDSPDMYTFFLNLGPLKNINEKFFHGSLPFWNQIMEHGAYDEFWKTRNILPHFKNTKPAVLIVGGWYDSEDLYGPLNIYRSIEEKNPSNDCRLIMGPWSHGGWARSDGNSFGDFLFPDSTSKFYNDSIIFPFFNYYLKDKGRLELPEVLTYRTGSDKWIGYKKFPPDESRLSSLYLGNNGSLLWEKPTEDVLLYDEFVSDPFNPVPYTSKFYDSRRMYNRTYMSEDQRFADARPDVLTYSTEPLDEDYTISGPIDVDIYVSTSGTDADWVVKIIDVYPYDEEDGRDSEIEYGGYQRLIRYEIMRGKFRNSYEKPEPFVPNKITNVGFRLNDIDHTFRKGHRIMIQIQSSFFPFFDRNPQKFVDIYNATEDDFQKAVHRVYFGKKYPSHIKFHTIK
ncbi:peptidase S15 [Melioribacter roseus P3M-2]|uniref:Peptidase S15 n=1 Tax=Melioribacter roseus (strain DSM 23840 / JCM 17771 / VKM B-2668 / P3M-2) TaxID=1191523 RepID=I6ZSB9_MELRP|nr:CocE/NonD family hydrolase [Melioribacter roseus]AFN74914.1 peptidase S15 [Melioribacter roseus P3M-2]